MSGHQDEGTAEPLNADVKHAMQCSFELEIGDVLEDLAEVDHQ